MIYQFSFCFLFQAVQCVFYLQEAPTQEAVQVDLVFAAPKVSAVAWQQTSTTLTSPAPGRAPRAHSGWPTQSNSPNYSLKKVFFQVCKSGSDICYIRLDFDSFVMSSPLTTTYQNTNPNGRGQCQTAQFTASSDGVPTPVLCGTNTGYHMILNADVSTKSLDAIEHVPGLVALSV